MNRVPAVSQGVVMTVAPIPVGSSRKTTRHVDGVRFHVQERTAPAPERVRRALTYWAERLVLAALGDLDRAEGNKPPEIRPSTGAR